MPLVLKPRLTRAHDPHEIETPAGDARQSPKTWSHADRFCPSQATAVGICGWDTQVRPCYELHLMLAAWHSRRVPCASRADAPAGRRHAPAHVSQAVEPLGPSGTTSACVDLGMPVTWPVPSRSRSRVGRFAAPSHNRGPRWARLVGTLTMPRTEFHGVALPGRRFGDVHPMCKNLLKTVSPDKFVGFLIFLASHQGLIALSILRRRGPGGRYPQY